MEDSDPLLSELCSICHMNPPKYRCPRCSTRTCSLPCTRRHKLWSQCSGVRDPGAYLKRSELATEAAFDRDFNFISGIERSLERADRDAENRGIELQRGSAADGEDTNEALASGAARKRKHPGQGLVKGEAGFLRGAEAGAVKVMRAPRGMTRNKQNTSRWHPKHKCLSWTVEWIPTSGDKMVCNSLETRTLAQAYDGVYPIPKEERPNWDPNKGQKGEEQNSSIVHEQTDATQTDAVATTTETPNPITEKQPASETAEPSTIPEEELNFDLPITPHRGVYFYLHRPRTSTKKPVLAPLHPRTTLANALRERTVLEFPTLYVLPDSAETLAANGGESQFILEEEYLRTAAPEEAAESENEGAEMNNDAELHGTKDIGNVDEQKVMEVLKQDLFDNVPEES
ncbi:uncharacterized protein N7477_005850 [Penicillium maclennaniae]|uniref:uncharacterized protein n=1 Tax=Penicillium maclennaniae TaxID=1343394 RepID=UPI002541EBF2|nr:uncharacterized protein N7477_005850 [Penicillium maclennaniae]KAJ5670487.1 hypothetical protein N7477_005850 [Penicillium maclennaniae]